MVDKPFARKRSGGPRTAAGKAVVAGNAISHGVNARLIVLDGEKPAEFEALFQGLVADYSPQGTMETLIVHRVAQLIWKQRRLDGYEHQQLSQAAAVKISIEEIFRMMNFGKPADAIYDIFESLDVFTAEDLETAEEFLYECDEFQRVPKAVLDPVQGPGEFSMFWRRILGESWLALLCHVTHADAGLSWRCSEDTERKSQNEAWR